MRFDDETPLHTPTDSAKNPLRSVWLLALLSLAVPGTAVAAEEVGGRTLLWHAFDLAVLFGVIGYFARTPIRDLMATRRTQIEGELEQARLELERAESQLAEWQGRISALDQELDEIRSGVRAQAEGERDRIVSEAESSAERIRANAAVAAEQEIRRARDTLRVASAELAVERAGEILEQRIGGGDRDRFFDEFMSHLQNAPSERSDGSTPPRS